MHADEIVSLIENEIFHTDRVLMELRVSQFLILIGDTMHAYNDIDSFPVFDTHRRYKEYLHAERINL